jgi:hypothetical protein
MALSREQLTAIRQLPLSRPRKAGQTLDQAITSRSTYNLLDDPEAERDEVEHELRRQRAQACTADERADTLTFLQSVS